MQTNTCIVQRNLRLRQSIENVNMYKHLQITMTRETSPTYRSDNKTLVLKHKYALPVICIVKLHDEDKVIF